jgi:hypothetical protein
METALVVSPPGSGHIRRYLGNPSGGAETKGNQAQRETKMAASFSLRSTLTDGFVVSLDGNYPSEAHAQRAAESYMRHYSDPCGLGVRPAFVAIIDNSLLLEAA